MSLREPRLDLVEAALLDIYTHVIWCVFVWIAFSHANTHAHAYIHTHAHTHTHSHTDTHAHTHPCAFLLVVGSCPWRICFACCSKCAHAKGPRHWQQPRLRLCRIPWGRGRRVCPEDHEHDQLVWKTHSRQQGPSITQHTHTHTQTHTHTATDTQTHTRTHRHAHRFGIVPRCTTQSSAVNIETSLSSVSRFFCRRLLRIGELRTLAPTCTLETW